ncbi:MAG: outer membrane beta-barrel protein [Salibacteraceae bacterium]
MRIKLFLAVLFFGITSIYAQDDQKKPQSGDVVVEDKENSNFYYESYSDYQERKNKHWQGLDIGINGLSFADGDGDVPPTGYEFLQVDYARSFYFGVNLFEVGLQLNGELIKVVTGLGFDFNNIQLKKNYLMVSQADTMAGIEDVNRSFKNNNMKNSHITIPLLLAFNTSPKNSTSWHFAAGMIFSYRLNGKQKVQFNENNIKNTITRKSRMHQNPFRATATVRLGYGNLHVFGNYTLTEYWESGEGPSANLWSIGIKVLPW